MLWHGEVPTAEMKRMMNFTANAARQPFHVAVFTFHDVLKDATRIKMEMWIFFFTHLPQLPSVPSFSLSLMFRVQPLQRLCHPGD